MEALAHEVAVQVEEEPGTAEGLRRVLEKQGLLVEDAEDNDIANALVLERFFGIASDQEAIAAARRHLPEVLRDWHDVGDGAVVRRGSTEQVAAATDVDSRVQGARAPEGYRLLFMEQPAFECDDCSRRFNTMRDFLTNSDFQTNKYVEEGRSLCKNCYEAPSDPICSVCGQLEQCSCPGAAATDEVEPSPGGASTGEGDCISVKSEAEQEEIVEEREPKRVRAGASPAELDIASEILGLSSKVVPAPVDRKPEDAFHG